MQLIFLLWAKILVLLGLPLCVCANGETLSSSSLPYNFTIAAVNTTLPNANLTGVPLVLGQNGEQEVPHANNPRAQACLQGSARGFRFM